MSSNTACTFKTLVIFQSDCYILSIVGKRFQLKSKKDIGMKFTSLILIIALFAFDAFAAPIVLDPDDFIAGTNLSTINPHVKIATTGGGNVYAADISPTAANGNNTQGLGSKIFAYDGADEWFYMPELTDPITIGMEITFKSKINYFSLLCAELFSDAGPGSEPLSAFVYDEQGNFITNLSYIASNQVNLGWVDPNDESHGYWHYAKLEYFGPSIGKVIIGGNSEPTTLDRLEFNYVEVPEPNAFILTIIGIFGLLLSTKRKRRI